MNSFPATPVRTLRKTFPDFAVIALLQCGAHSQTENQDLTAARAVYEKEVEFSARPIRDRYLSRLDTLKRTLGARGDARGAAAVQDEIDRLKALIPDPGVGRLAGRWNITWVNGFTRIYSISTDGFVTCSELDWKPINPPIKAKLVPKGSEFLLEIEAGKIERLKVTGKTLVLEHFNPKSLFESGGSPNNRGTGKLTGP